MKELLFIDCCIRGEQSRTAALARAFLAAVDPAQWHITRLDLMQEGLKPFCGDFFEQRQTLLEQGALDHPRFRYAHQFAAADAVVIAAPLWDLSFPALLKIYIENVSVDGITFGCNAAGCYGICKGSDLVFLTTRGGFYEGSPMEQGSRYLAALKDFFGFDRYTCVAADGLDSDGSDPAAILQDACIKAAQAAAKLAQSIK